MGETKRDLIRRVHTILQGICMTILSIYYFPMFNLVSDIIFHVTNWNMKKWGVFWRKEPYFTFTIEAHVKQCVNNVRNENYIINTHFYKETGHIWPFWTNYILSIQIVGCAKCIFKKATFCCFFNLNYSVIAVAVLSDTYY